MAFVLLAFVWMAGKDPKKEEEGQEIEPQTPPDEIETPASPHIDIPQPTHPQPKIWG